MQQAQSDDRSPECGSLEHCGGLRDFWKLWHAGMMRSRRHD
jgi:hypothetical protein